MIRTRLRYGMIALVGLGLMLAGLYWLSRPMGELPFAGDPRFVVTTLPTMGPLPGGSLRQRFLTWLMETTQKIQGPKPLNYTFAACPPARCSVHGLLNQCMQVTGVRYVILRDIAGGAVEFGHTNALNGVQWVRAFTDALQSDRLSWWDSQKGKFSTEPIVLLTNHARTVIVVPQRMVAEVQQKLR